MAQHPVIVIGGPTASGKSALALAVAETILSEHKIHGVIINADSQQVYADLQILSARPDDNELARAEHRLYGVLAADEACDAQRWRDMAITEINRAHDQGKIPILVGGTGMYLTALMAGMSDIPDIPKSVRDQALELHSRLGNPAFHAELAKCDPVMAARLNPNDSQRLIRAWEVYQATGKSLADFQNAPRSGPPPNMAFYCFFLVPPRDRLYEKINHRFDQMVAMGVVEEVRKLDKKYAETGTERSDLPLTRAHGVPPLRAYLRGECSLEAAGELIKRQTRNYAKRQSTWIRHQMAPERLMESSHGAVKCSLVISSPDVSRITEQPQLSTALKSYTSA